MCDQLSHNLTHDFVAAAIHGDKSQGERDHVLNQFRTGRSLVLVATDVAAHGLDIKDIRVVINYDFPTGVEDYVHRIGRTGRAGATGLAYTFFGDQDAKHASDLIKILEGANQHVPPSELRNVASRGGGMGRARRPWGSGSGGQGAGRGGRNDTGYGGRDGGRGSWGIPERGGGRGFDHDSRDGDRYRHSFNESVAGSGSYHNRSFHESMVMLEAVLAKVEAQTRFQDGETTEVARLVAVTVAVVLAGMTGHHQHVNVPHCTVSISI